MSILSKSFNIDFTQVPNTIINDNGVSLQAKGLYLFMISKPDNWQFGLSGLEFQLKETRKTILKVMDELISFGYMEKIKNRVNGRQSTNDYILHLEPQNSLKDSECKKETQYKRLSKRDSVTYTTSNTNTSNTNTSNTNTSNTNLNNTYSKEIERNDFNQFRENFKNIHVREPFYIDGFGFDNVPLITNYDGLILHGLTLMFLKKEDSFEIWKYLYKTLKDDYK